MAIPIYNIAYRVHGTIPTRIRHGPIQRVHRSSLGLLQPFQNHKMWNTPNSAVKYPYLVDYKALRWIYFLDPPGHLGGTNLGLLHAVLRMFARHASLAQALLS